MLQRYSEFLQQPQLASDFARRSFQNLATNIAKPDFPCYFAKNVLTRDTLYVAALEGTTDRDALWAQAAEVMKAYSLIEQNPDPYRVLVIAVDIPSDSWEMDDALLWDLLHFLRGEDPESWNPAIPASPEEHGWSFSFRGIPWFFNVNSPNNTHRKSRNVTDSLAFVIQRTDQFDGLAAPENHDKLRNDLRSRIFAYDGQGPSPALAGGADNQDWLEWKQFHTPNLNSETPKAQCPYHHA